MGLDYALVYAPVPFPFPFYPDRDNTDGIVCAASHLKYTIPPAIVLTLLLRPLANRLDLYKILFLLLVATTATTPWDSYLIRRRIWTYPPNAVLGPVFFAIPAEELFFFVIQTYNTTLLYLLLSKPTLPAAYLSRELAPTPPASPRTPGRWIGRVALRTLGQLAITLALLMGAWMVYQDGPGTYFGLIVVWAAPVALLLWTITYESMVSLPRSNTLLPIALPTLYLWLVDTVAMRRGTWAIESGTKLGVHLWPGLEIEEALFFLVTNGMIVLGLIAFDRALAVMDAFPHAFPVLPRWPSPRLLLQATFYDRASFDERRLAGIAQAVVRLKRKSRSFHLASSTFEGRLRIDLILLSVRPSHVRALVADGANGPGRYSWCRIADDLVDEAGTTAEAQANVDKLRAYLDAAYGTRGADKHATSLPSVVRAHFPADAHDVLLSMPIAALSPQPLYDLLKGFEMDLAFDGDGDGDDDDDDDDDAAVPTADRWPIATEADLELYAVRVAGTVAELCLDLVFAHAASDGAAAGRRAELVQAGRQMGIALQLVNIARDVTVDAGLGRVYLPLTWLKEVGLTPRDVLREPHAAALAALQARLLDKADAIYDAVRSAIEALPVGGRRGMRVAVESYMEIGRVLRQTRYRVQAGRATVPRLRRLRVAWSALTRG
ncbi:MAG: hypothetical protein M1826_007375 [Phylliscum demangeonii]|nr:MAG: hypothetical protein M1826_007375 [Phylliscum demangeonii]